MELAVCFESTLTCVGVLTAASDTAFATQAAVGAYNYAANGDLFSTTVPDAADVSSWSDVTDGDNGYGFLPGFFGSPSLY